MGVAQVFTPGATMAEIVAWVRANVHRHVRARLTDRRTRDGRSDH